MRNTPVRTIGTSKKQTSRLPVAPTLPLLAGCEGIQSVLAPRGPHAQVIANISWIMFWGAAAILLLVMALALYAVYRHPNKRAAPSATSLIVAGGLVLPVVTLSALLAYGVQAMGTLRAPPSASSVQIEVIGNRWWWDIYYRDAEGRVTATANELHIPAGQPVAVSLRTRDVIHSFWVPNLAGKIDLIPGRTNHLVLEADQPGIFRGQCAEYCGVQHARMAFHVVADTPADYRAWLAHQRAPARTATEGALLRGQEAFREHCLRCHTVRGLGSAQKSGPDLTHVGSRQFLAAGTLANAPEQLLAFITDSQKIKPGSAMPSHRDLAPEMLLDIAGYLESLD